jgi:1-acyl-sn-glycerol-3-phosphate acyltransferase
MCSFFNILKTKLRIFKNGKSMGLVRSILRTIAFSAALCCYFIISTAIYIFYGFSFDRARPYLTKVISITSIIGLKIFNVKVEKNLAPNLAPIKKQENYLIVSNHLSYLDILIISSNFPSCFVTSVEMKNTPFLGQVCLLGGCLFVERRKKFGITNEVNELSNALVKGLNVAIFPEAKSTNGEIVLRFKRPLFQAAINAKTKVLPICINYRTLDGEKINLRNRDKIFWYGEMPFLGHVLTLFSHRGIVAELNVMASLNPTDFLDKNALSDEAYSLVNSAYNPIINL